MTTKWRLVAFTLVGAAALGQAERSMAMELLAAPGFEAALGAEVPFWSLGEYRTADPSMLVDSASLAGFADNPIDPLNVNALDRGLWIKPFSGSDAAGTTEAILSQIVPAVPGKEYTFTGDARFEANYGGTAGFSTDTQFEMAFLDAGGMVIGSPLVRDLEAEVIPGLGYSGTNGNPDITPLVGIAPAGAASVRVRAQGINMSSNTINTGAQSAFVDNFSLVTSDAPSTQLLMNGGLNIIPPTVEQLLIDEGWEFVKSPETSTEILRIASFANNPATGGANGVWVSPFLASAQGGSGVVQQTVPGVAGTEYTFSAGARWEANFFGDTGTAGENEALLELAFLDGSGEVISSSVLDLRENGKTADNLWSTHSVSAAAPAGTVDIRVAGIINNLTTNPAGGAQSAFWDDFSLMAAVDPGLLAGDFDGNGSVGNGDLTLLLANWGGDVPPVPAGWVGSQPTGPGVGNDELTALLATWGQSQSSAVSVPEPASVLFVMTGLAVAAARRRV